MCFNGLIRGLGSDKEHCLCGTPVKETKCAHDKEGSEGLILEDFALLTMFDGCNGRMEKQKTETDTESGNGHGNQKRSLPDQYFVQISGL